MEAGRQRVDEEKEFYKTLDEESRGSCCTCNTLVLFFFLLFIIINGSTYFLSRRLLGTRTSAPSSNIKISTPSFKEESDNRLVITEKELQSIIWGGPNLLIPLTDKSASIDSKGIILSGKVPAASQPIELLLLPAVKDNKIIIENITLQKGPASFLNEFSDTIKEKAGELLNQAISDKNAQVEKISCEQDKLIIETRAN